MYIYKFLILFNILRNSFNYKYLELYKILTDLINKSITN